MSNLTIRPSREDDVDAIAAIYAHHVLHGTGTFETEPPTPADMAARRADVLARGLPYVVAERGGRVLGFAYCNWFKPRPAYRFSAEDSVYIDDASRSQGLGAALLTALEEAAVTAGVRKLIAVIGDAANAGSIGLHRKQGFEDAGAIRNCGWKFDRWLDIVLMEKTIGEGARTRPE